MERKTKRKKNRLQREGEWKTGWKWSRHEERFKWGVSKDAAAFPRLTPSTVCVWGGCRLVGVCPRSCQLFNEGLLLISELIPNCSTPLCSRGGCVVMEDWRSRIEGCMGKGKENGKGHTRRRMKALKAGLQRNGVMDRRMKERWQFFFF